MFLNKTLSIYFLRKFFFYFLMVLGACAICIFFANMLDILTRLKSSIVPISMVTNLAFLKMPYVLNELMPKLCLIAVLFMLLRFAANNELIVLFTSGIPIWKMIQPLLLGGLIASIVGITIIQPIGAIFLAKQEAIERKITKRDMQSSINLSDGGLYIAENFAGENRIYLAQSLGAKNSSIANLIVLILDDRNKFIRRFDAKDAVLEDGYFEMISGVKELSANGDVKEHTGLVLPTGLSYKYIIDRFSSAENIAIWKIPQLVTNIEKSGISADKFVLYYYKLVFRPFYVLAMILLAVCFANVNPRGKKQFRQLVAGVSFGLLVYGVKEVISAYLVANQLGFALGQFIPIALMMAASLVYLVYKFE